MREIKFRAWDTDNQQFVDCSKHTLEYVSGDFGGLGNRYYYQQYTGLKDKYGIEIYEGDIVTRLNIDYLVEWNEKKARYNIYNPKLSHPSYWGLTMSDVKRCEIIGNIYENPELLQL